MLRNPCRRVSDNGKMLGGEKFTNSPEMCLPHGGSLVLRHISAGNWRSEEKEWISRFSICKAT